MRGDCIEYLFGGERTEHCLHCLDLHVFIIFAFFFVIFVIVGDVDRAHVRELHGSATGEICKFSTKSGIGDDQVARRDDGQGLSRLNNGTPSITLSLEI